MVEKHEVLRDGRECHASAPGKVILFGEHAVVYQRPAIAIPVTQVKARAVAAPGRPETGIVLHAENLGRHYLLDAVPEHEPLAFTCRTVLESLDLREEPDVALTLRSEIPIASGMGSGAATATAIARALARWLGHELSPAELSAIVYETEKIHHGTPSGIDNTVVAFEQPVWFVRGQPVETFQVGAPMIFLVADTGIHSPTRHTVGDVRQGWEREPARYEALFDEIGALSHAARAALEAGQPAEVGRLMDRNHELLVALGVSAPANDRLAAVARSAGALGAKLSGGGRGGNNVALVPPDRAAAVGQALLDAGAVRVLRTQLD